MGSPGEGSAGQGRETPCRVIGVAGGSGSGKSLFARAMAARLHPRTVVLISEDDYYRRLDGPHVDPRQFDFDAPAARDHAHLAADLGRLRQGLAIDRPVYSFRIHAPLKRTVRVAPAEVVIVEGLHVLHDAQVRGLLDFSIFLQVDADIRFIRRLLRDRRQRGRSVQSIAGQYLATVRPAHERFVEPTRVLAHLVLTHDAGLGEEAVLERWLEEAVEAAGAEALAGGRRV